MRMNNLAFDRTTEVNAMKMTSSFLTVTLLVITLAVTASAAVTSQDNMTFNITFANGTLLHLSYPWQPFSECIFNAAGASLYCMRSHNPSDILKVWKNEPTSVRYVSVNCLRQEYDQRHKHVCLCATVPVIQDVMHGYCYLRRLEVGIFNSTSNIEALDLSDNRIESVGPRSFYGLPNLEYLSLSRLKLRVLPYGLFCDNPNLLYLDLSSMDFDVFPSHCFRCENNASANLLVLNLSENQIADVPADSFDYLHRLVSLDLRNNQLVQLHDASFREADSLKHLDLSYNELSSILPAFCQYAPGLETLMLRNNSFTSFDFSHTNDCGSLLRLDLSSNNISNIRGNLTQMHSLHTLNISGNQIDDFAINMAGLAKLSVLDLSFNALTNISRNDLFYGLTGLKVLNISFNKISYSLNFRALFKPLVALEILDLSHNRIYDLPAQSFYNLKSLTHLLLSNGAINTLDTESFVGLLSLTKLDISCNNIETIPTGVLKSLVFLEHLDLSHNQITAPVLFNLPSLRTLHLENNRIFSFPDFTNATNLEFLNMSLNNMAEISSDLTRTPNVQTMDLSFNKLDKFPINFIKSSKNLKYLYLQSNRLEQNLTADLFTGVVNLTELNLSDNQIKLSSYLFSHESLTNLKFLNISNNPLRSLPTLVKPNTNNLSLKILDVSKCNIEKIDSKTFQGLESMQSVNISFNNIETFQPFFVGYDTRPVFHMGDNPLVCDCTMTWLHGPYVMDNYKSARCRAYMLEGFCRPTDLNLDQFVCLENNGCNQNCECYKSSKNADISTVVCRSNLSSVPSPIAQSTRTLFLDGNQFSKHDALITFLNLQNMATRELYINNSQISYLNSRTFVECPYLEILDLSDNVLTTIPSQIFVKQMALKQLYLRNNKLSSLDPGVFEGLGALAELDISGNRLTILDQQVLKRLLSLNLKYYFLARNPWLCDCRNADFKDFIDDVKYTIRDRRQLYCGWKLMLDLPKSSFQCSVGKEGSSVAKLAIGILLGILAFLLIFAAFVYYRREIVALIYARTGLHIPGKHRFPAKPFDVYINYDPSDQTCSDYIDSELLPKLRRQKFNLQTSADIIADIDVTKKALEDSQCSIFIVSKNFTTNPFFVRVFHVAEDYCKRESRYKVILIIHGDIDIPTMEPEVMKRLRKGDYITSRSRLWWERLMYELPVPRPDALRNDTDDVSESDVIVFSAVAEDRYQSIS